MRNLRDRYRHPGGPLAARRGGGAPFTPAALSPYAWYDVHLGGSSTQITDSSANGRAATTNGATTAAATWLPYTTPAVYFPGLSGNYVWCADSAALSFNNDIEVVMRVKAPNWATGAGQTLAGQYVTSTNDRRFRFYVSGTGDVGLSASEDGTSGTVRTATITPTTPLAADTWQWHRMRFQRSNGSNCVGTLDTAADTGSNSILPLSFTANGTGTGTACSGLANTSAPLELGTFTNGTLERFTGQIGRMIYKSGIDGTTVADFNADLCAQTGYTDAYSNAWTVARASAGLKTVVQSPSAYSTRSVYLLGTDDKLSFPNAAIPPAGASDSHGLVVVGRSFATSPTSAQFISTRAVAGLVPGVEIRRNGTTANIEGQLISSTTSRLTAAVSAPHGQVNVMGVAAAGSNLYAWANGTVSANQTRTPDTNTGTGSGTIGAVVSTAFNDFELIAFLTFDRELTAAERAALVTYYGGGL